MIGSDGASGQASLLMLGVLAALLAGTLILFGFGQALGARSKHQPAADLAAVSAAQVMRRTYARLFEPALLEGGRPNPRYLSNAAYLALARAGALRGARRNGAAPARVEVTFPGARFAPTRVSVSVHGEAGSTWLADPRDAIASRCRPAPPRSWHPIRRSPSTCPAPPAAGGYDGPLAYRQGKPMPGRRRRLRPHGFRGARRGRPPPVDQQRLSLRRRAGPPVGREAQPSFVLAL
jgi:hypothetical protein